MNLNELNGMERIVAGTAHAIIINEMSETRENLEFQNFSVMDKTVHMFFNKKDGAGVYEVRFDRNDFSHQTFYFD